MAIKHPTTKAPGEKLFAVADWNADHTGTATPDNHGNEAHTPNFQQILPIGSVLMYNGTGIANVAGRTTQLGDEGGDTISLPGWFVCNGNAGTPNLFNKFIRSMTASGNTGGSDDAIVVSHLHTINHDHASVTSGAGSSHNHAFTGVALGTHGHTFTGSAMGTHGHTFTGSALAGHSHTFTGSAMGTHYHRLYGSASFNAAKGITETGAMGIGACTAVVGSGYAFGETLEASGGQTIESKSAGTPAGTNSSVSAGTPAGTNSTTSAGTPAGSISSVSAGTPSGTNTAEASHTHSVDVAAFTGNSGTTGSSGTNANMPAYYSLIFITRMS